MDGLLAGCSMNLNQDKNPEFWIPRLISEWRRIRTGAKRMPGAPEYQPDLRSTHETQDVRPLSQSEIKDLGSSLRALQRGLTGQRELAGTLYMEDSLLLGAYLMYYWPVSYVQTCMTITELVPRTCKNSRILDLGCGPGPVSAAFLDAGATSVTLVDSSPTALALAEKLLETFTAPSGNAASGDRMKTHRQNPDRMDSGGRNTSGRTEASPIHIKTCRADLLAGEPIPKGPYDYIVASHLVNELWNDDPDPASSRLSFLDSLVGNLAPEGILLISEPATLESSRNLLALRDRFLIKHPDFGIAAPCPQAGPCPVLAAGSHRSCHAEYSWMAPDVVTALANSAGLERNSVKSAWIAFQFQGVKKPDLTRSGSASDRSYTDNSPDTETKNPGSNSCDITGRIISEPMLNKAGKIRYLLCQGFRIVTVSAKAIDPDAKNAGFFSLTRGDSVSFSALTPTARPEGSEDYTQGFRFDENSSLKLLMKAPRAYSGHTNTGSPQHPPKQHGFNTGHGKILKGQQQSKNRTDTHNRSTPWTETSSKPQSGQQPDLNSRAPADRADRMSTKSTHGRQPESTSRISRASPSGKKNKH